MAKRQPNPYFKFQQFTIFHHRCAMKVGTDGVLLGAWADTANAANALDIGTGTGLIALMLAQRNNLLHIHAIDIDADATKQAIENVEQSRFSQNIRVKQTSIQDFVSDCTYDLIVSNPPFFSNSLESPDQQRTMARHTSSLEAEELISIAVKLLSPQGRISLIYPFDYKEALITLAFKYNLTVSRITNVYPTPESTPKRILIELDKRKKEAVENDLIIETQRHQYSPEFGRLVKDFYLKI